MSDNVVENYGWESDDGPHSCDYIAPEIVSILNRLKPEKVLDLGSGNGSLCSTLNKEGFYVAGVEYDQKGVEIASKNNPNIQFYNLGVQDDPISIINKEGRFDLITSTEVIEHIFSPHLLPQFAAKLLKSNGYLLVTTPYHGYLKNLALSVFNKWDDHHTALWHGGHIKFWSKNTLTQLLEEHGFKVVKFSGVGRAPYLWKSMVILAQKV